MTIMDGLQAIKKIRQHPTLLQTPIIVISAKAAQMAQKESLKAGSNAFLPKPVDRQKLLALISSYLNLEWIYQKIEDEQQKVHPSLIPPSPEALEALYKLASFGMMSDIRKQMDHLEQLDAKYAPFANKLRELARGFEDEKIVALVEGYLK